MLVPFALLAVPGLLSLRRGAANGFWWFSIVFFGFFMLLGWFYWSALDLGIPAPAHRHMLRMRPAYVPEFDLFKFALSVAYTAFFVWVLVRLKRSAERPLVAWAVGATVVWGLLTIFFWEYADSRNSYRPLVMEVTRQLPPRLHLHLLAQPGRAAARAVRILRRDRHLPRRGTRAKARLRHPAGARHAHRHLSARIAVAAVLGGHAAGRQARAVPAVPARAVRRADSTAHHEDTADSEENRSQGSVGFEPAPPQRRTKAGLRSSRRTRMGIRRGLCA